MGKGNTVKKLAIGAALAGAAGYVVGILTAPAEGKKTREQIKKTAESGVSDIEKQLKQLHSELGELVDGVKDTGDDVGGRAQKKLREAVKNAHTAKDKLREILSMVHEGEATDKELKKALEDARRSLEHLKQFIKK